METKEVPSVEETLPKIHQWGVDRNIIGDGTSQAQFLKLVEEFSEYAEATNITEIKDGIGDSVVVLAMIAGIEQFTLLTKDWSELKYSSDLSGVMALFGNLAAAVGRKKADKIEEYSNSLMGVLKDLAELNGVSFDECVSEAYEEIKDRKGVLLDGIFIKSTDEKYEAALKIVEERQGAFTVIK